MAQSISSAASIRQFLTTILKGDPPTNSDLVCALDELVSAYHNTPDSFDELDDKEAPATDYDRLSALLSKRFPDFGFYAVADPLDMRLEALGVGDAIDDLADIVLDMQETLWRYENVSEADGNWYFRFSYYHWGVHIRSLSLYLCHLLHRQAQD